MFAPPRCRASVSLDGLWDFSFSGPTAKLDSDGHQIRTPGIWQAQFPALRNTRGTGRYRRRIEIPSEWESKQIFLVMEGVFHEATILVDNKPVASNRNGWTQIEVNLTSALSGARAFSLGIDAHVPDDRDYQSSSFSHTLAGKQDWYGIHGGIWKPARLEARNAVHLTDIEVQTSTDLRAHCVRVKGKLSLAATASARVTLSRGDTIVAQREFPLNSTGIDLTLGVANVALWSPQSPNLYETWVELISGGAIVDSVERIVGFRIFEARDSRLFLNGEPFYMFGALDQDWYPEEECHYPSESFLEAALPGIEHALFRSN